jgi:hypothetical protein
MYRFMQRFGRERQARWRGTGPINRVRRRNQRLNCEALESRQLLSGYYVINESSGKVLDDPNFSKSNGAVMQQFQLNGGANQQWNFVKLPDGNQKIVNASSGMVLANDDHSTSDGTPIVQRPWLGYLNEQWQIVPLANGNDMIVNAYSHKVLDNPAGSKGNGTQMIQWRWNGGANQQWTLLAAYDAPPETVHITNTSTGNPLLGTHTEWTFVPLADYYDLIVNSVSGEVLDDPNFSTSNGTAIQQYQLNGGLNQQWLNSDAGLVDGVEAGTLIMNARSRLFLDDPTGNDTSLIQDQEPGFPPSLTQCWTLI